MPTVYDLTPMTRRADVQRRIVVRGFEASKRKTVIGGLGASPGLILMGMLMGVLGAYAVILPVATAAVALWLFEVRSGQGMRLKHAEAIRDRRRTVDGSFFVCGHRIDPLDTALVNIRPSSIPVTVAHDLDELLDPLAARRGRRSTSRGPAADGWGELDDITGDGQVSQPVPDRAAGVWAWDARSVDAPPA